MKSGTTVLFLDDDPDLREVMKASVLALGASHCLVAESVQELKTLNGSLNDCALAILDINLGTNAPSGLDAFHWLRANGFCGHIVFLTGHAHDDPRVRATAMTTKTQVLSKPIDAEDLEQLIAMAGKEK